MILNNKELPYLYNSPYFAEVVKSRTFRWASRVDQMEEDKHTSEEAPFKDGRVHINVCLLQKYTNISRFMHDENQVQCLKSYRSK
jgi:hypothetical protein